MAATETEAAHPSGDSGLFRASITEDFTSSTSEAASSRLHDADAGHERLLKHTASNDGKAITHCRPSRPPHYLLLAILVRTGLVQNRLGPPHPLGTAIRINWTPAGFNYMVHAKGQTYVSGAPLFKCSGSPLYFRGSSLFLYYHWVYFTGAQLLFRA